MVEFLAPGVFVEEVPGAPRPIEGVSTSTTAFIGAAERGQINEPIKVQSFGEFERLFGGLAQGSALGFAVRQFFENGGTRAVIVRVAKRDGGAIGSAEVTAEVNRAARTGLYALDRAAFNLLCIPPYRPSSDLDVADWETAAQYCLQRRAFLIIDAPAAWTIEDAARKAAAFRLTARQNAALYFPRIIAKNPFASGALTPHAPCGVVAGIISRTDAARGAWKVPAGLEAVVKGAAGLSGHANDAATERLTASGVNALREFPGKGIVVWGARTLASTDAASEWKYVPVRRLALYLQESILRGTHWAVFEPNNEKTWGRIRDQVANFLNELFRRGALQGARPEQAFFVRCDAATTTQSDIDNGRIILEIGFAPLKPAEFVVFRLQQIMQKPEP